MDALRQQVRPGTRPPHRDDNTRRMVLFGDDVLSDPREQHQATLSSPMTPRKRSHSTTSMQSENDCTELQSWVATALVGHQKVFNVSKHRRTLIHRFCDKLNDQLRPSGRQLLHESGGTGRNRKLYVTLATVKQGPAIPTDTTSRGWPEESFNTFPTSPQGDVYSVEDGVFRGPGHRLGRTSTDLPPPRHAAALAALERQAIRESIVMSSPAKGSCRYTTPPSVATGSERDEHEVIEIMEDVPSVMQSLRATGQSRSRPLVSDTPIRDKMKVVDLAMGEKAQECETKVPEVVDLTESVPPHPSFVVVPKQLYIYVDDRERNRQATPRFMRTELDLMVTEGILANFYARCGSKPQVVERRLAIGDFAFSFSENGMLLHRPLVERKTIGDLVQRSQNMDHWSQMHRLRDASNGIFFLLLEGDFRTATQFSKWRRHQAEVFGGHIIDSEEAVIRFMGRSILLCRNARFVQTKDLQGTLRAIGAIGLLTIDEPLRLGGPENSLDDFFNFLHGFGLPIKLAEHLSKELGSNKQLESLYASCHDDKCRDQLLAPTILDCLKNNFDYGGSELGWSRALYKGFSATPEKREWVRQEFLKYKDMVEDHSTLLESLYTCGSCDEALNKVLDTPKALSIAEPRLVYIEIPWKFKEYFPPSINDPDTVFRVVPYESNDVIPCIVMKTTSITFRSANLVLFLLEGDDMIQRLRNASQTGENSLDAVKLTSALIRADCCNSARYSDSTDSCILLVRGLSAAHEKWAKEKRDGYQSSFRAALDLLMADLSITHNTVIMQAIRLKDDTEILIQQLAMSCYHNQLLTELNRDVCTDRSDRIPFPSYP